MRFSAYFEESSRVIRSLSEHGNEVEHMARAIFQSQIEGGKLLLGGNGGSCADAEHFAGELTCTFNDRSRRPFNALSLSASPAAITAWSNDFDYVSFFARQVEAHARQPDVLFLMSTSGGNRETGATMNLVLAAEKALEMGLRVFSLVGKDGGELHRISTTSIKVASRETSHIQEAHIAIIHAICVRMDELAGQAVAG